MELRFEREKLMDWFDEAMPLFEKHFSEVSHFQDIALDINKESYRQIEEAGVLRTYTVRKDGKLVGYSIYFVKANIRYQKSVQAVQDVLFIDPDHRGVGRKLIEFADRQLQAEGVQVVYHHVKTKPELNFGPLLERMGYQHVDQIYAKRLDTWE